VLIRPLEFVLTPGGALFITGDGGSSKSSLLRAIAAFGAAAAARSSNRRRMISSPGLGWYFQITVPPYCEPTHFTVEPRWC